jgi:hypothetical protein
MEGIGFTAQDGATDKGRIAISIGSRAGSGDAGALRLSAGLPR